MRIALAQPGLSGSTDPKNMKEEKTMKINAKFFAQHGVDSSHGALNYSLYWAEIEEEASISQGILLVGEYESEPFDDGMGGLRSSCSPYIVFHPFDVRVKYNPRSGFAKGIDMSDAVEAELYQAWQANPACALEMEV